MSKSTPLPKKSRNLGRAYLENQLKKKGFSRRKAVHILNSLFAEIEQALARGEEVEFPLGKLKVVRHKHRTQRGRFLSRKMTTYKQPFTVVHETDRNGDRWLNPKPIILPPRPGSPPGTKPFVIDPWKLRGIFKGPIKFKFPPKPVPRSGK